MAGVSQRCCWAAGPVLCAPGGRIARGAVSRRNTSGGAEPPRRHGGAPTAPVPLTRLSLGNKTA